MEVDSAPQNQIVLHEDKRYYPSADETYGPVSCFYSCAFNCSILNL